MIGTPIKRAVIVNQRLAGCGGPERNQPARLAGAPRPPSRPPRSLPVQALVVVVAVEELNFLERLGAGQAAGHGGVHEEEEAEGCGPWWRKGPGSQRGRGRVTAREGLGHGEGREAQAILAEGLPSSVGRFSWATACVSRGNEPSGALGRGRSLRFYRPKHLPRYSQLAR